MMNTPKRVDLLVFDLDGVLVDVSASYRLAIRETVAALGGGAVSPDDVQTMKNAGGYNNDWDLSRELLRRSGRIVERARVIEVFNRFYLGPAGDGAGGLIQAEEWLLPNDLFEQLRRRYRLAIFTGRPRTDAEFVLRRFGVAAGFDHVITMEDVASQKPHPEGLFELQRRHAPAAIAAYIGDTVDDARCAASAGIRFFAILPERQHQRAELEALFHQLGSRSIVTHVAEAARLLLEPHA